MITPFEMYVILQLDTIASTAVFMFQFGILVLVAPCMFWVVVANTNKDYHHMKVKASVCLVISIMFVAAAALVRTFLPTTKSAAAIFIAPKIINSGFVQDELSTESKEIYSLFKAWLTKEVNPAEDEEGDK